MSFQGEDLNVCLYNYPSRISPLFWNTDCCVCLILLFSLSEIFIMFILTLRVGGGADNGPFNSQIPKMLRATSGPYGGDSSSPGNSGLRALFGNWMSYWVVLLWEESMFHVWRKCVKERSYFQRFPEVHPNLFPFLPLHRDHVSYPSLRQDL